MALKWVWRNNHFSEQRGTARLGNLILYVIDIDGENQNYGIDIEAKAKTAIGKLRTPVFDCEVFYGGIKAARERVEYLARCLYYGLPVKLTDWEIKQNAKIKITAGIQQAAPTTQIRDIFIRGIYHIPGQDIYLRAEYIANIDKLEGKASAIPISPPAVVLKDILTDRIYTFTIPEFKTKGFVVYDNVDDKVPEVIR